MAGITHHTAADGSFSGAGSTAWGEAHDVSAGSITNAMLANAAVANLSGTNTGDQTNISGNAATVTTNANLTGPITSSGNATAIASQTGTGTKFVVDTSPTLTTPIIGSYTFATLPSAAANSGATARVTDIGPATAGSLWLSNGTIWKPVNGRVTLGTLAARYNRAAGLGESSPPAFQVLLPAAFLSVLDRIRIYGTISKAGATTTGALTLRVGTAGTTADTLITGTGGNMLAAANRSGGFIDDLVVQSATSIGKMGSAVSSGMSYAISNNAYSAATVISNVSSALYISVTITPGATDDVALEDCTVEYICV